MAEGQPIAGMAPTGRKVAAPALDVVEVTALSGLKHQAFVYREQWHNHTLLTTDLQDRLGFLENPEVSGIVRLAVHDRANSIFVYPTGTVWTIAEIVRTYADNGAAPGVKAGLELCYLVGEMLAEASDRGSQHGLLGHGNINPWTLSLKGDGQPLIVGYGLPQIELLAWRENSRISLGEDTFRYAPPERIETGEDEFSSDLFSLVLVSLEMMMGRPVYDGVLVDVKQQATRGEGMRRLYQWREKLPQNVREVMGRALKPDPDTRFPSAIALVYAVHDLLGSIDVEGPSLLEVMAKVRASEKRGRALKGGQTQLLTPEEMAELAADLQEIEQVPLPPPRLARLEEATSDGSEKPRWKKATPRAGSEPAVHSSSEGTRKDAPRANAPEASPPPRTQPSSMPAASPTDRPRRRMATDSSGIVPLTPPDEPDDRGAERDRLRRRLRGSNLSEAELAAPDDVQLEPVHEPAPTPARRLAAQSAPSGEALAGPKRLDVVATTLPASRTPAPTLMGFMPQEPPAHKPPPPPPTRSAATPAVASPAVASPAATASTASAESSSIARTSIEPLVSPANTAEPTPLDITGSTAKSAAAALLERLRTSGDRRRRPRADEIPAESKPVIPVEAPAAAQRAPSMPVTAPQQVPFSDNGKLPPPPPAQLAVRTVNPVVSAPSVVAPQMIEIRSGLRVEKIAWRAGETACALAVRAATELGAWRVDPSGRMFGGFHLERDGQLIPSLTHIPTPDSGTVVIDLVASRPEIRMVEVRVRASTNADPDICLRTPLEISLPCRWVVNGLAVWLGLSEGDWAVYIGSERFDGDRPVGEALVDGRIEIRIAS